MKSNVDGRPSTRVSSQDTTFSTLSNPGNSLSTRRISSASAGSPSTPNPTVPSTASHGVGAVGVTTAGDAGVAALKSAARPGLARVAGVLGDNEGGRTRHRRSRPGHLAAAGAPGAPACAAAARGGGAGPAAGPIVAAAGAVLDDAALEELHRRVRPSGGERCQAVGVARCTERAARSSPSSTSPGADCTHAGAVSTTTSSPVIAAIDRPGEPADVHGRAVDRRDRAVVLEREQRAAGGRAATEVTGPTSAATSASASSTSMVPPPTGCGPGEAHVGEHRGRVGARDHGDVARRGRRCRRGRR